MPDELVVAESMTPIIAAAGIPSKPAEYLRQLRVTFAGDQERASFKSDFNWRGIVQAWLRLSHSFSKFEVIRRIALNNTENCSHLSLCPIGHAGLVETRVMMEDKRQKAHIAHEAILLSRIISEKQSIKITFLDGEYLIDQLRWHTLNSLGLISGKVVNKNAIKYWEVVDEQ